jgi:hypothetical protein
MGSLNDTSRLVAEVEELSDKVWMSVKAFMDDFQLFEGIMPKRLKYALERCPETKDTKATKKCLEEFAEELKYLTERLDAMTEELNTAYNALRTLLDIYNSIDHGH